jgi:hypothetical protein
MTPEEVTAIEIPEAENLFLPAAIGAAPPERIGSSSLL